MNWYFKYEATGGVSGPMTEIEARAIADVTDGIIFQEGIFELEQPAVTSEEVLKTLMAEMASAASVRTMMSPDPLYLEAQELLRRAIDALTNLSREKLVTGTIQGGALSLDAVPEGVSVDIRDYDTDGMGEENLEEDETGSHFQAG